MRTLRWIFLLGFWLSPAALWAQPVADPVSQAREAYDRGDYPGAIGIYKNLVKNGADSPELYYNLGNAEFKAGHLGQAVANYRRAMKRAPQDEDIRYNLNYVRTFIHQPAERQGPLARWLKNAFEFFPSNGLALGALAVFWVLAGFATALIFSRHAPGWLRWAISGLALIFIILAGWGATRIVVDRNTVWGVITASRSEARNGPSAEFQVGFVIPEGREVRVLGREGDWVAVGLTSEGYKGWIKHEDLAEDE
jgi:tetratricopeptide (TPR) repeat protein